LSFLPYIHTTPTIPLSPPHTSFFIDHSHTSFLLPHIYLSFLPHIIPLTHTYIYTQAYLFLPPHAHIVCTLYIHTLYTIHYTPIHLYTTHLYIYTCIRTYIQHHSPQKNPAQKLQKYTLFSSLRVPNLRIWNFDTLSTSSHLNNADSRIQISIHISTTNLTC
jgi:hypothetical protein